ncbi:26S proteasome non-ATPase regulatory subunit 10 [Panicum miliaceum]|uniref:26S proteasome non-ATPase regulatory subunit 10 n=1 Tax=Panicum miliaceum TaxID=4540 RepID=A0A3L6TKP3_PANMI|nr:26S proteasome non-ATPase regulatory subunit 10 [Panicum miliaceum]
MAAMDVDAGSGGEGRPSEKDLFSAAESGDASALASLTPADLSLRNKDSRSLVHVAAAAGHPQARKEDFHSLESDMLGLGFDGGDAAAGVLNAKDEEGWAPIHSVASTGNAQIVEILLERGADVDLTTDGGRTALHYAASKGRLNIAEKLIAHGAKVNKKDKFGCTPLHRAASTGNAELCEFLIEEGAEVDAVDRTGQTPLMHAVVCENQGVAFLLIRHGADVDVEDKEGYTVLGRASNSLRPALIDAAKAMLEGAEEMPSPSRPTRCPRLEGDEESP